RAATRIARPATRASTRWRFRATSSSTSNWRSRPSTNLMIALALLLAILAQTPPPSPTSGQSAAQDAATVSKDQVVAAIGRLATIDNAGKNDGSDYAIRMDAGRTIRRGSPEVAIPLLVQAATSHENGYIRFRALVLLSGYPDPRAREVMIH